MQIQRVGCFGPEMGRNEAAAHLNKAGHRGDVAGAMIPGGDNNVQQGSTRSLLAEIGPKRGQKFPQKEVQRQKVSSAPCTSIRSDIAVM